MIIFFVIIGIYWDTYFAYGVIKTGELKTINCPSCKELFLKYSSSWNHKTTSFFTTKWKRLYIIVYPILAEQPSVARGEKKLEKKMKNKTSNFFSQ